MRTIYWRELRELTLVGLPVLVGLAFLGLSPWLALLAGAAVGAFHGGLDQRYDANLFLRHRAVRDGTVEGARTLAGLTWLAAVAGACLVVGDVLNDTASMTPVLLRRFAREAATLAGGWAVLRFLVGDRFGGRIVVAFVAMHSALRSGSAFDALFFLGAACLLARSRIRPIVLLLLAGWTLLEASHLLNSAATESTLRSYPSFGLDEDGTVHYFERGSDEQRRIFHRRLDANREEMRTWKTDGLGNWPDGRATLLAAPGAVEMADLFPKWPKRKRTFTGRGRLRLQGTEIVLLDAQGGVEARDAGDDTETFTSLRHDYWRVPLGTVDHALGLVTVVGPVHPTGGTVRLRRFEAGGVRRADAVLRPVTFGEQRCAQWRGVLALARPPVLNVVAAASAPPPDWDALFAWWWRDPLFAGGRYLGFLVLSVLVGWWCARRAARIARYRCATTREGRVWAVVAFVLGPLGLIWMRITVRSTVVLPVGDASRAAHLDAAPATDAPWPEPARTPLDVHA